METSVYNTKNTKKEEMSESTKAMWRVAVVAFATSVGCQLFANVNMKLVVEAIQQFLANLPM